MDDFSTHQQHSAPPDTQIHFVPDQSDSPEENSELLDQDDSADESTYEEPENTYAWQASEFIHHQKKGGWYGVLVLVVVALIGIAVITKQVLSVLVFIAMGGAVAVYANKEPRVLNYQLDKNGVTVGGKLYRFNQFRSYAVFNDVAWHSIDLDPLQRFQTRLTLMFDSQDLTKIESLLSEHLPRIDRQPDIIERLTRTLKF